MRRIVRGSKHKSTEMRSITPLPNVYSKKKEYIERAAILHKYSKMRFKSKIPTVF